MRRGGLRRWTVGLVGTDSGLFEIQRPIGDELRVPVYEYVRAWAVHVCVLDTSSTSPSNLFSIPVCRRLKCCLMPWSLLSRKVC